MNTVKQIVSVLIISFCVVRMITAPVGGAITGVSGAHGWVGDGVPTFPQTAYVGTTGHPVYGDKWYMMMHTTWTCSPFSTNYADCYGSLIIGGSVVRYNAYVLLTYIQNGDQKSFQINVTPLSNFTAGQIGLKSVVHRVDAIYDAVTGGMVIISTPDCTSDGCASYNSSVQEYTVDIRYAP